jgi:hypothetical protein
MSLLHAVMVLFALAFALLGTGHFHAALFAFVAAIATALLAPLSEPEDMR